MTTIVDSVRKLSLFAVVIYVILSGCILYVDGLSLRLFFKPFGIHLKHFFLLSCAASFINQITPFRGGAGFKAWYMKKEYGFDYMKSVVTTFGEYILIFLVTSAFALMNMAWLYASQGIHTFWTTVIFLVVFLSCLFLTVMRGFRFPGQHRVIQVLNEMSTNWKTLVKHKGQIVWLSIYASLSIGITTLMFIVVSNGMSVHLPYQIAFQLALLSNLAFFVNITPGSIGIVEFVCLAGGVELGLEPGRLAIVLLVMRAIRSTSVLLYGFVCKPILFSTMKSIQ